jgi:hypothetical protein
MSEILVNKLTGTSTAGSILVTGEGNSTTTNLQQGLAKAWVNSNIDGTAAVLDSLNISSLDDDGTGQATFHYTNSMNNALYSALTGGGGGTRNNTLANVSTPEAEKSASQLGVDIQYAHTTAFDPDVCAASIHGDLA